LPYVKNFYSRHIRYIRMAGAYSPPLCRTSGHLQGSSWSIDDIKLLMCVWTNRQHRYVPRSLSVTFVDDSNTTAPSAAELSLALTETERFDAFSRQQIYPGKVAGWAHGQQLWDQVSQTLLCGHPLRMCDQVKLVGGCINAPDPAHDKLNLPATADVRVKRAQSRLPRLERLPEGMTSKAATIRSLIASVCTTGTDIQAPSLKTTLAFNKSLFAALRPKGRAWMSYWVSMAVCFPGHAIALGGACT